MTLIFKQELSCPQLYFTATLMSPWPQILRNQSWFSRTLAEVTTRNLTLHTSCTDSKWISVLIFLLGEPLFTRWWDSLCFYESYWTVYQPLLSHSWKRMGERDWGQNSVKVIPVAVRITFRTQLITVSTQTEDSFQLPLHSRCYIQKLEWRYW